MLHGGGDLRERTFKFARRVARVFDALPRKRLAALYGTQLVRAANSIAANYREAQRARTRPEHYAKLGDCLREADETLYWLEAIEADGLLPSARLQEIKDECGQLVAILVVLIRKH